MAGEDDINEISSEKIMSEFIEDVKSRWQDITEYKKGVGIGIPYSQAGKRYKDFIREKIGSSFDEWLRTEIVFSYLKQTNPEKIKEISALTRAGNFEAVQAIYNTMPESQKQLLGDKTISEYLAAKHANTKAKAEMNAPDEGYCLKGITESLYKVCEKYGIDRLFPENNRKNGVPKTFLEQLSNDVKKHTFRTHERQSFADIMKNRNICAGAIVILNNKSGDMPRHAMFWAGERDGNGQPLLLGFNGEDENVAMYSGKDGSLRSGTVIDIGGLICEKVNQMKIRKLQNAVTEISRTEEKAKPRKFIFGMLLQRRKKVR